MNIFKLFWRVFINLLITSVVFVVAFLGMTWLIGILKLPNFLQPSTQASSLPLAINVVPTGSIILLDDQLFDPSHPLPPGDYTIMVSHDGYVSAVEELRVHSDQNNQITIHLMPDISVNAIADDVTIPGWDQQGNLFFLNLRENKVYKWSNNTMTPVLDLVGEVNQLIYLLDGTRAIALVSENSYGSNKLQMVNFQTGEMNSLPVDPWFFTVGDGEGNIWGLNNDLIESIDKPVWNLQLGSAPVFYALESPNLAQYGDDILVDSLGQWLAIEGSKGIAIWEIATGKLMATFENATESVWVQNPRPGLAFLSTDRSLNFAQAELEWESVRLLSNLQAPLAVMPGGSEIVFTRYNPFEGGTSFWAVDTATFGVRLLSEAKTESGRAGQFAVSLDGKKIAFVNERNTLYLVVLEP